MLGKPVLSFVCSGKTSGLQSTSMAKDNTPTSVSFSLQTANLVELALSVVKCNMTMVSITTGLGVFFVN